MSQPTQPAAEPQDQSVRLVIGAVAVTLLLASLGQTIVSTALPTIVGQLGGLDHLTWVVIAYLLSSTVVAPIYGKLGDLYGRKIVLQAAIVIFLIGAVLSAMATSMTFLIIARAIQGLGGGGLMVVAMTVVADIIPPRQRGKIQGLFGAVFGVATVIGPLAGGFIVEHLSWQWIFLINLPLGLLALAVIGFALKPRAERVKHSIDYAGFVLLSGGLTAFVLATSLGGNTWPWFSVEIIGLIVLAVVALGAFLWVESRAAEPVLPLTLFRNNTFAVTSAVGFLVGMAMFGSITFLPMYLQLAKGISPTDSALQLVPMMVGLIGASMASGFIMTRTGRYKLLPTIATAVLTLGLLLLANMQLDTPSWQVALYMFLVGAGIGPVNSVSVTATQNAVAREIVGAATAGATLFRQIGGSIGVSIFGAIFTTGLASRLGDIMPAGHGGGTSSFSAQAVAALPEPVRTMVLEAFASALHPVFFTAAGASILAFGLSFLLEERTLANTLRQEPKAEIDAEESATAAMVGAPVSAAAR
ncbi:MDR family MFS transporter [Devosia sp. 63-57]|uniref:MDR family MFS transporter n=1 Tax=Devosia sp. 63-57 TaxID=1895751 RepID=UPI00086D1855|nr:MDR family MFS transporter [Devosia sp. 63-57]ODT47092.1 MAG: EmrB/QacA family drug resistance transporter [Pelagibacterium sp. SCN 63-126]ODU88908.1 MAG: EmrB/QacA family drug resistance transporter [Pelagibacterium sp. SCN 63-17]OJX43197.1 MAG: EmrB/QacA family drug resistance transporter [Devosia sp. 63-57]